MSIGILLSMLCGVSASLHAQTSSDVAASAAVSGVSQNKAADKALRKDVLRALSKTKGLNTTRITVRVRNGAVMLQGSVPDQAEVDIATRAASDTSGVTSVKNTLIVLGPAGSQ